MLLLLLNYVVLRALWKIDLNLLSTLVNKSLYYYYLLFAWNVATRMVWRLSGGVMMSNWF